jgi:AcrR family transcriptional regulator
VVARIEAEAWTRAPLSRERVLGAAVALADSGGFESLSMRKLANELGVVPMALYKHVANKDLSARRALLRHPWASRVMESRTEPTPMLLAYMDSMIGMFMAGGFSIDLTHHTMHAMGSRLMGFSQEMFNDNADVDPAVAAEMWTALAGTYPHIHELYMTVTHDDASVVGPGCDDQFEFEFALDLMLDGLQRLKDRQL